MAYVQHGDVQLHLQQLGEAGPPVVMLHGLLVGSLASWYFTAAPPLAQTRRVALYDLRGHGRSDRPPTGYDLDTMAADLAAIVEHTAPAGEPVALVGHSYGALVALTYALAHPARVERLALVEAPLPPSRYGELTGFLGRSPEAMLDALPDGLRGAIVGGRRRGRRLLENLRALACDTTLLADLRATADIPNEQLAALTTTTLCVYGRDSACLSAGERIAERLPNGELTTLPGGHYLPVEQPQALTAALVAFLGTDPTRPDPTRPDPTRPDPIRSGAAADG